MMPRELAPIDSMMTVQELGSCTLAVEECNEGLKHPIYFITAEVNFEQHFLLSLHTSTVDNYTLQEEESFTDVMERGNLLAQ